MGGCWSQSIDSEAMAAETDLISAEERSAGNELVQNKAGQFPAQGGSSEYIGAFVRNDMVQENAVPSTLLDSNNQTVQPLPRVSDVDQNRSELTVDVPLENTVKTSVQPSHQNIEEQPMVEQTFHNNIIEEQPVTLPALHNQMQETLPPVSSAVYYDYQNDKEPVFNVPVGTTVNTIVNEPVYQHFPKTSIVEHTLSDQIIEEQPVIRQAVPNQIYKEHLVHPLSPSDNAVLPRELCENKASLEVKENVQVVETQQAGHDLGVVFEGRIYRTRVFDPNLKEYVYVGRDDLQPRGGLVM